MDYDLDDDDKVIDQENLTNQRKMIYNFSTIVKSPTANHNYEPL